MNDNIQHIIERLEYVKPIKECCTSLNGLEIKTLLDYIYYLQEQNGSLKELCNRYEVEHSTVFEEWKEVIKNG